MKLFAFSCGMFLILVGVMFTITSYTLYETGTADAGSMFLFGLAILPAAKLLTALPI
jgi:hypothetical protein